MDNWKDYDIDPRTIPDEVILSERGRRNAQKRLENKGGLKPIPAECPKCHEPCRSKRAAALHCKAVAHS